MQAKALYFVIGAVLAIALVVVSNAGKMSSSDSMDWSTSKLAEMLASGSQVRLIDVREPHEYAAGHIPGAELIPLGSIESMLSSFDKSEEIALICRSGNRSSKAAAILRNAGFQRTHNVLGGMLAWKGAVVTGQ